MTEPGKSSEALSGVVLGKAASTALAGAGAAESVPSTVVKIDGGALVARVLQSQHVKYLFAVNGGHTWPILACCAARLWDKTHSHATRAVMRIRGRRMGANHWNTGRLQCHSRLRTD